MNPSSVPSNDIVDGSQSALEVVRRNYIPQHSARETSRQKRNREISDFKAEHVSGNHIMTTLKQI